MKRSVRCWPILFVFVCIAVTLYAQNINIDVDGRLTKIAKDISYSQKILSEKSKNSEAAVSALSRESDRINDLTKTFSRVETANDINQIADQLKIYSYKATSQSEQEAFREGLRVLENRVRYLARTENPKLVTSLNSINELRALSEENFRNNNGKDIVARAQLLASRSRVRSRTTSDLLGANVKNGKTHFSVYSPAATDVKLVLFKRASDKTGKAFEMKKSQDGIWRVTIAKPLYGIYYGFSATGPTTNGNLFNPKNLLSDPYAFANVNHDGKSIVINRSFKWTDQAFKRPAAKDLVVYEMHIKDYSAGKDSGVPASLKGKYLGLLKGKGTGKVLGNLIDLGVNAVELMPVMEFDDNYAGVVNHWGYMTSHYFAPETKYASGDKGQAVKEFKKLVNGLHKAGIAVILDVVYNHTAEGDHRGKPINLKGFDNPGYYRLMNDKKHYWNGTGCGNEFRSDSPMGRKLILDSLKYWMTEYHIDGFRFDLGTIIDKTTMKEIISKLPRSVYLFSEPWAADWKRNKWGKSDFRNTRLAKWNDDFREKVRGFVSGSASRNDVMTILAGTCFWWAAKPTESLNYVACHDGYTLHDLFHGDLRKSKLSAIMLLTAQGIPMMQEGQEFDRSKKGNHNSYNMDNAINWINWDIKKKNIELFNLYKGLIALRAKYNNFKHTTALNGQHLTWIQPANQKGLGMILKGSKTFIVLMNGDQKNWVKFNLPPGEAWKVICDGNKIDEKGLYTAKGDYKVPPVTGIILMK